ncbi:hypothetical protein AVEN_38394-1 [Araneus ventricosus]|uniref:Uncharacterized protein n=1 Tax=Araneus ventricosus TaxID=182803 RepID=A0A4Y2HC45_ARAVE|nr:hypothetical protein AVEN_38394-1 [Araneus ventricosus]
MSEACEFCGAFYWKNEVNSSKKYCCHDGKVCLPNLTEAPDLFKELVCSNSQEAKNYRQYIREYNAELAFASMGAEIKAPPGTVPYCFRIHDQIYHMVSPLYSNELNKSGYGRLYIFDSIEASNRRIENNQACLHSVMEKLGALLRSINPFAESYLQMHQLIQSNPVLNVKMVFMEHPDLDLRRYNAPTSRTEVAVIFVGDNGEPPANRDICIYPVADSCENISALNQCSDPMIYPLLFPHGECGCNSNMEHVEERRSEKRVRVTQLQYYSYSFAVRNAFSILHNSGKTLKSHDSASVRLQSNDGLLNNDETLTFLDGRYVSAPEGMWRLNEFSLSEKPRVIMKLAVHLPNEQVVFQSGQEVAAVARASMRHTTLTAWFLLNQHDVEAHNYNYADTPQYYVFDKSQTLWKRRQRGGQQIIGRMPVVNLQDNERYYLRMLLLRRPGVVSNDDLKTVNGIALSCFQQTCTKLGFLEGGHHRHDTMTEASQVKMPSQLRKLFVVICAFGEAEDVRSLWEQFKDVLCEDLVHRFSSETGPQYALAEINQLLNFYGLILKKINLPHTNLPSQLNLSTTDVVKKESKGRLNLEKMNEEQTIVVQKVLSTVYENKTPKLFFLAGTGKTFVYSTLIHIIRGKVTKLYLLRPQELLLRCWMMVELHIQCLKSL